MQTVCRVCDGVLPEVAEYSQLSNRQNKDRQIQTIQQVNLNVLQNDKFPLPAILFVEHCQSLVDQRMHFSNHRNIHNR